MPSTVVSSTTTNTSSPIPAHPTSQSPSHPINNTDTGGGGIVAAATATARASSGVNLGNYGQNSPAQGRRFFVAWDFIGIAICVGVIVVGACARIHVKALADGSVLSQTLRYLYVPASGDPMLSRRVRVHDCYFPARARIQPT